ncbi:CYFA0S16e02630g1_1 [Cyberlindnera fabianii]|uniref:CYFA0S16e02630g1_1 n=1 Tax=Cyberlindnera fabianii TaxID=36022 RepID=A0A061BDU7_CYBFA|nr:CYFA0S16e02630g1_1 [Cyberlindnera fabianii]
MVSSSHIFTALTLSATLVLATPPACFLACTGTVARWCTRNHADFPCLCHNSASIIGCLVDICPAGDFFSLRDHLWGTCVERLGTTTWENEALDDDDMDYELSDYYDDYDDEDDDEEEDDDAYGVDDSDYDGDDEDYEYLEDDECEECGTDAYNDDDGDYENSEDYYKDDDDYNADYDDFKYNEDDYDEPSVITDAAFPSGQHERRSPNRPSE